MNPSPTEALGLLDRAVSNVSATRQDHVNIQLAVKILAEFIEANKPKPAAE
jgi:hypothetical protein